MLLAYCATARQSQSLDQFCTGTTIVTSWYHTCHSTIFWINQGQEFCSILAIICRVLITTLKVERKVLNWKISRHYDHILMSKYNILYVNHKIAQYSKVLWCCGYKRTLMSLLLEHACLRKNPFFLACLLLIEPAGLLDF